MNELLALIAQFMIPIGTEKVRYGAILRHGPVLNPKNPDGLPWSGYTVELFAEHTDQPFYEITDATEAAGAYQALKEIEDVMDRLKANLIELAMQQQGAKP
jgi:hypothetical protein